MSPHFNRLAGSRGTSAVKRVFVRGLVALLPTILSIAILVLAYQFVSKYIASPINIVVKGIVERAFGIEKTKVEEICHPLIGFLIAVAMVYLLGYLVATYLGRRVLQVVDRTLTRFPVLGMIYPHARQIVDFLFTKHSMRWTQVVAFQYPRKGVYSVGFVTGEGFKDVREKSATQLSSVFVPTSPTPLTGYVVMVPVDELIFLDIRVDEALRFIISGGVLVPPAQQPTTETPQKSELRSGSRLPDAKGD